MPKPPIAAVRAVAKALEGEFKDVESAASAALFAYQEWQAKQNAYGLLYQENGQAFVVQPFSTTGLADKWADKNRSDAVIVVVLNPEGV